MTEWRRLKLPITGETVIVAVSGGADSVSLLLAVVDLVKRKKIGHRIITAHFDHGLRGAEAAADEEFVCQLAADLGVEYIGEHGKVSKKGNLEQNARNARYEFLMNAAIENGATVVLTGHTLNDQAETFLLNLIRGSGLDGLSAIPVTRPLGGQKPEMSSTPDLTPHVRLVRPLLTWAKRSDTESFCRELGIKYRLDAMNDDLAFKRVRIRKELIPMLETMNPKMIENLADTAKLLTHRRNISGAQTTISAELTIGDLRSLDETELNDLLRLWLGHHRGNLRGLGLKHIKAIGRLVFSEKSGRKVELPGNASAERKRGKLVYQKN